MVFWYFCSPIWLVSMQLLFNFFKYNSQESPCKMTCNLKKRKHLCFYLRLQSARLADRQTDRNWKFLCWTYSWLNAVGHIFMLIITTKTIIFSNVLSNETKQPIILSYFNIWCIKVETIFGIVYTLANCTSWTLIIALKKDLWLIITPKIVIIFNWSIK